MSYSSKGEGRIESPEKIGTLVKYNVPWAFRGLYPKEDHDPFSGFRKAHVRFRPTLRHTHATGSMIAIVRI